MQDQASSTPRDNLLGVCHAVGDTFGFNPLYLRLVLLAGVMLNAEVTLAAYAILGLAVLAAKLLTWRERASVGRNVRV